MVRRRLADNVTTTLQIVQETRTLQQALGISVDASAGNLFGDASAIVVCQRHRGSTAFRCMSLWECRSRTLRRRWDNPVLSQTL